MSRVGKKPVVIPQGINVAIEGNQVSVKGPRGELSFTLPQGISVDQGESGLEITRSSDDPKQRSLHGMARSLINNMVEGVVNGYDKRLVISGVGYNAKVQGDGLVLNIGFSHPVIKQIPEGLSVECPTATTVVIKGIDKQKVGQFAAAIRAIRPPEPYNAKGVSYDGETIHRKAGKAFGSSD